jgi:hypothetical protein
MVIFIKENGRTIRQTVTEYIFIRKLELNIKDIGKMICSMVPAFKYTQMATNTKECLNKEKEMDREHIILQKVKYIKVNGTMEKLKVSESVLGLMVKNTRDIGKIIKKMDRELIIGLMVDNIKAFIEMIKNMEWEHTNGSTVENI